MKKLLSEKLFIFGMIFVQFSCSEELYEEKINQTSYSVRYVNSEFYKKNKSLINTLEHNKINNISKIINDTINGITIDTDLVKYVESQENNSYTFMVLNQDGNFLDNLVLMSQSDGTYQPYLLRHYLSSLEINALNTNQNINFTNKTKVFKITESNIVTDVFDKIGLEDCVVNYTTEEVVTLTPIDQCDCFPTAFEESFSHVLIGDMICTQGGGGGGGSEIVTSPHSIGGGGPVTPCDDLIYKDSITEFASKMIELKTKAGNQNFESAYVLYQNASQGLLFSQEQVGDPNDKYTGGQVELNLSNDIYSTPTNGIGFIHCHLNNGTTFGVFSFSDILGFAQLAVLSTRPVVEFGLYVTSDLGTFALKIKNKTAFRSYFQMMNSIQNEFEIEFAKTVKKTDGIDKQKKGFLKFLKAKNLDAMIEFYEKNSTTNNWNRLKLNSNESQIIEEPCN
ncbi:hypothetical protein [Flavobacterium terrigena]|uniref:Uncharacterized protein n=1 Tax=Flavobacterium terrigena TaxID=402734 RepID=A0A1H6XS85_9FLAO|nr:hypothetical protein [Flavobacterium terrigena]SEJ27752.1 hypothetical protein SAMN05660918_2845 [Flavobacterium terrigena]